MQRLLVPLTVAILVLIGAPTLAHPSEEIPVPADYRVTSDGTLIIGGDVYLDCRSLLEIAEDNGAEESAQIREGARVCSEAGFPPRGGASLDAAAEDDPSLPNSGGPPLVPGAVSLVLCGCALQLFAAGLRRR